MNRLAIFTKKHIINMGSCIDPCREPGSTPHIIDKSWLIILKTCKVEFYLLRKTSPAKFCILNKNCIIEGCVASMICTYKIYVLKESGVLEICILGKICIVKVCIFSKDCVVEERLCGKVYVVEMRIFSKECVAEVCPAKESCGREITFFNCDVIQVVKNWCSSEIKFKDAPWSRNNNSFIVFSFF